MKIKELKQKTEKELIDLLIQNQDKLGKLRFDLASKKLKNVREIRDLRKTIAQILTLIKENHGKQEKEK